VPGQNKEFMKAPRILDYRADDATDARAQLRAGILAQRAVIAPTYFYDALGARLFAAITQLPEYPLARVEAALIAEHAAQMAHAMRQCAGGGALQLLDLGAADGGKAGTWIAALRPLRYLAVDVALETGRTHQIRVHMKETGHPILCDPLYGDGQPFFVSSLKKNYKHSEFEEEIPILNRLALHAAVLSFTDMHGKQFTLEAEMPKDLRALINQLDKSVKRKA